MVFGITNKRGNAIGILMMVLLIVVIVALAIINSPSGNVASDIYEAEDVTGGLLVTSVPTNAEVIIDGDYVGQTPYETRLIPKHNSYTVKVRLAGYEDFERGVLIARASDRELVATLVERR
jgi:hypothetical protein